MINRIYLLQTGALPNTNEVRTLPHQMRFHTYPDNKNTSCPIKNSLLDLYCRIVNPSTD